MSQDAFVQPRKKEIVEIRNCSPNLSATDKAFHDYCIRQNTVSATEESSRKMFLLSLLSDVARMTDQQHQQLRMNMISVIDGIL